MLTSLKADFNHPLNLTELGCYRRNSDVCRMRRTTTRFLNRITRGQNEVTRDAVVWGFANQTSGFRELGVWLEYPTSALSNRLIWL